jgi:lipoyl(octanoyl) transferase
MHGFALNVAMDLAGFERIVPCGIADCQVCNLQDFVADVSLPQVRAAIAAAFANTFNLQMQDFSGF